MTRSSPMAAPTTALMATKWVTTTVSDAQRDDGLRPARRARPRSRAEVGPGAGHGLAQPGAALGQVVGRRRDLGDPRVDDGRHAPAPLERARGLAGAPQRADHDRQRPSGASAAAIAAACADPSSSRPGSWSSLKPAAAWPWRTSRTTGHRARPQAGRASANRSSPNGASARSGLAVGDEPLGAEGLREGLVGHGQEEVRRRRSGWRGPASTSRLVPTNAGDVDGVGDDRLGRAHVGVLVDLRAARLLEPRLEQRRPARAMLRRMASRFIVASKTCSRPDQLGGPAARPGGPGCGRGGRSRRGRRRSVSTSASLLAEDRGQPLGRLVDVGLPEAAPGRRWWARPSSRSRS